MLRYLTAGESHGPALTAIVEGFPSGITFDAEFINVEHGRYAVVRYLENVNGASFCCKRGISIAQAMNWETGPATVETSKHA